MPGWRDGRHDDTKTRSRARGPHLRSPSGSLAQTGSERSDKPAHAYATIKLVPESGNAFGHRSPAGVGRAVPQAGSRDCMGHAIGVVHGGRMFPRWSNPHTLVHRRSSCLAPEKMLERLPCPAVGHGLDILRILGPATAAIALGIYEARRKRAGSLPFSSGSATPD